MAVRRIVTDLLTDNPGELAAFYRDVFGMETAMDGGFIVTIAGPGQQQVQLNLAREGGSDTPLPVMSVEVDDFDDTLNRIRDAGIQPSYGPVTEPWGVRRFYFTDPAGHLINVLTHTT